MAQELFNYAGATFVKDGDVIIISCPHTTVRVDERDLDEVLDMLTTQDGPVQAGDAYVKKSGENGVIIGNHPDVEMFAGSGVSARWRHFARIVYA